MTKRLSKFRHRNGSAVDLPLLVPSFSSKGFGFFTEQSGKKTKTRSETSNALEACRDLLPESLLVSAYDLHHQFFKSPERTFRGRSLILLDSGGYELNPDFDSSEPRVTQTRDLPFDSSDYLAVLTALAKKHSDDPLLLANFDWATRNHPYEDQITSAASLFEQFPQWSRSFILKPDSPSRSVVSIEQVAPHLSELGQFDVIGVTEKELGKNLIDRLRRLAHLRIELTRAGVEAPIHIWGGLDPIVTPLYFFAGADIFDGVSWLRYSYHEGLAVNREAYAVLASDIALPHDHAVALALSENLYALEGLTNSLRAFSLSDFTNFAVFDHQQDALKAAFQSMQAKIPELEEVT
jgi:hypothetical protein